ncbi:hypothetical protein, variant [Verruconis gallopava]|uniref:Aldehyde dehydrogenase n=1 Tax=Verruconis gallopava TaxID=253628 RepID=A0A0D2AQT1_9PEZI|nr:hypothetical protein, variant [Verruconis gallopava]KIW09013.1 hypothetical protein, variant [Verruconis gallopava]
MGFSTPEEFDAAYKSTRDAFNAGITKDKKWRLKQLKKAFWMMEDNKERICKALYDDLHKHKQESVMADIVAVQHDILDTIKNFDAWTKDEKPFRFDPLNFMMGTTVRKEPLGVTLIIGAWNYPMLLLLQPMVAAIAAGCAVILKPSDVAVASQDLLMEMIPKYLDQRAIRCVTAGPKEMAYILEHKYDHIFYTGSAAVAKFIHAAAAKHLTPVTLELGGQGPAIVSKNANIELAAKRIAATKFMNAGQVCLNVNHVLVDPSVRKELVSRMANYFDTFNGGKGNRPEWITHVVNDRNWARLDNLLKNTQGKIVYGGERDAKTRYFAPTIVVDVKPGDSLLSEELFGPILPVVDMTYDQAIKFTAQGEHPLALYPFTESQAEKDRISKETLSGGVTFNDCALHAFAKGAPFGGTGNSGTGAYHGPYGILTFSHLRTYVNGLPSWMEGLMSARYPPYSDKKTKFLAPPPKASFDREGNDIGVFGSMAALLGFGAAAATAKSKKSKI